MVNTILAKRVNHIVAKGDNPAWPKGSKSRGFSINIDTSGQPNWMQEIERVRREYTESPEQQAAREQREKRNRRIAAISDGLVALSNVTGAMAGATPIKQTVTMSDAHRKAVERAAQRRRENAARYETARRYLSGLQQQQDKLNADRYDKTVKARQDADKQADNLIGTAARLRQNQSNSDRNYGLQKEKFEEQKEHHRKTEALLAERNSISRSKGGGSSQEDWDEYARWEQLHPDEVNKIKTDNAKIDSYTGEPEKTVTSSTVKLVNAKMRQKYGSPKNTGRTSNKTMPGVSSNKMPGVK